ncbi:MAG: hypothetical protein EA376_09935 [Phycisphaeraceae bacterium]|nr:MAG: hypothetical protein EA376_09935 [Phycisphaeraceae bacterium]
MIGYALSMQVRTPPFPKAGESSSEPERRFASDVEAVVDGLRDVLGDLAEQVVGQSLRSSELSRSLGLDKSLAWKLSRLIRASDGLAAARHLPGGAGLAKILDALDNAGGDHERLAQARDYIQEIDALVVRHAGRKSTFRAMLRAFETDSRVDPKETVRGDAFRGAAAAWGVQALAHVAVHAIKPSKTDSETFDLIAANGLVSIRRLRADVPWTVGRPTLRDGQSRKQDGPQHLPLASDSSSDEDDPLLLYKDYCSQPPPAMRVHRLANGFAELELAEGPVGQTAEETVIIAKKILRALPRQIGGEPNIFHHVSHIATPVEWHISDMLVHESSFSGFEPTAASYAELGMWPWSPEDGRQPLERLRMHRTKVEPSLLRWEVLPRHQSMILDAMRHAGWAPDEFVLYRLIQRYPLLGSATAVSLPLPQL